MFDGEIGYEGFPRRCTRVTNSTSRHRWRWLKRPKWAG